MKIELTKGQCESLSDLIEVHLLDIIRNDTDIDNLNWVRNIVNAQKAFNEAVNNENHDLYTRVEEGLPDRNEKVVVTDGVHTWDYGEFSGLAYSFAREDERNPRKWNWKKHTVRTVNWWMPKKNALPEPPKEG